MRQIAPVLLLRLALLVAVLGSATLVVEQQNVGDPAFCGMASGCMAVRIWAYSHLGRVPLPAIGLIAYAALLALALVARNKAHTLYLAATAGAGGAIGAALLTVQALQIGSFCKWCVMVDTSAIIAAGAATWLHRDVSASAVYEAFLERFAQRRGPLAAWAIGAAIAGALPVVWGEYPVVPPLPANIAAQAVPGKATIVAFTDFQCPFCRKLHPVLHDAAAGSGGRVAIVRKMAPLAGHSGARPAALAYLCTPAERREEMASLLYGAPDHLLERDGTIGLAAQLGLDREAFVRCLDAPETTAELAADRALFESTGAPGLPFTFIGARVVPGSNADGVRRAVRFALESRPSLPVAWMLLAFGAVAAGLLLITLRNAPAEDAERAAPVP
jgi:uncharacterized membrane protein